MKRFNLFELLGIPQLSEHLATVQTALLTVLPDSQSILYEPMRRIVTAPSKRLRPALVIASACQGGNVTENVISACVSIELIHLASLVHDDIMDNSDSRRNVATVHQKEGLNQAILVGDYLFAKANQVAATINLEVAELIAKTIAALCEGQARELADQHNLARSETSYLEAINDKTAALVASACETGALASGLEKHKVRALHDYGIAFGMSFQLLDDVLDVLSSSELLGKPVCSDITEGIYTLPVILTLEGDYRKQLLANIQIATKSQFDSTKVLIDSGSLQKAVDRAKEYNRSAKQAVASFASEELQDLPDAYLQWALNNLVLKKYQLLIK